jgi:hypothetical protein
MRSFLKMFAGKPEYCESKRLPTSFPDASKGEVDRFANHVTREAAGSHILRPCIARLHDSLDREGSTAELPPRVTASRQLPRILSNSKAAHKGLPPPVTGTSQTPNNVIATSSMCSGTCRSTLNTRGISGPNPAGLGPVVPADGKMEHFVRLQETFP